MGWVLTWQNLAEEPFPHSKLDVSLVEAWLEGDGTECTFQGPDLLKLCSGGQQLIVMVELHPVHSTPAPTCKSNQTAQLGRLCTLDARQFLPSTPSQRICLPGRENTSVFLNYRSRTSSITWKLVKNANFFLGGSHLRAAESETDY